MPYIPNRGDLVWLSFNPQSGHEQSGRRPALVLSPKAYNFKVGLLLACPITNKVKNYPFEVPLSSDETISGVVLSDQVKSLDWRSRKVELISSVPESLLCEVLAKLNAILSLTSPSQP